MTSNPFSSRSSSTLVVDFSSATANGDTNNPLNPLGRPLRQHIWEALDRVQHDPTIHSVILFGGENGKKSNFSAGADLTEFGQLQQPGRGLMMTTTNHNDGTTDRVFPLIDLVTKIENFPKPIVAAIRGNALGGGLEVALSCHYRITDSTGMFGLPEVHVGVIPGAGGTQRLPRLVSVAKATEMILTGQSIPAGEAKEYGLVDQVIVVRQQGEGDDEGSLLHVAQKWASWAALMPVLDRRVGLKKITESKQQLKVIFDVAAKKLPSIERGGEGVQAALQAIKACTLPIERGSAMELEWFLRTLAGSQGKARRHAFFSVRTAQKSLGQPPRNHPLLQPSFENQIAGVVGAGLMGSGICMVLLQAGFTVYLVDVYKESLDKGVAFLTGSIQSYVKRGRMTEQRARKILQSLKPTQRMEDLSNSSIVVEAVIEDMKIKKSIFSALDNITRKDCILLSNTSTLDINEMASAVSLTRRPLFAGWHFFSPAHVMKLVEIVLGAVTSVETTCILQQLTKRVGKIGVVVGNCDGFVGNRLLISYSAETALLLEEGVATVATVDKACLRFGMSIGPFQMGDLAGLDIGYNIRKHRGWVSIGGAPTPNRPARYSEVADVMVSDLKRLGQKSGKGWYDYDMKVGKGRKPIPSQEMDALVRRYAKVGMSPFSEKDIIERVFFPLVNEGFKCLEEGIARQPSDIDVVYIYGYGWPIYRGGPMWWADHEVGLQYLLRRLEELSRQFPKTGYFTPSELLRRCVTMDLKVEDYYKLGLDKRKTRSNL